VTGVIDRLERAGYARRVSDPSDRRRVRLEVTPAFYAAARRIWGPLAAEWQSMLSRRFTHGELMQIMRFLRATNELGRKHMDRLRDSS
jgi:DNA-binding MarR family transcriptional regulator